MRGNAVRFAVVTVGAAIVMLAILSGASLAGQEKSGGLCVRVVRIDSKGFPRIKAHASVSDSSGACVSGLTAESFELTENGKPVSNLRFSLTTPGKERIAVALVVDRSGSMRGAPFKAARQAAGDFAARLSDTDLLSVILFSGNVGPATDLTADKQAALRAFDGASVGGETALYDAVLRGVSALSAAQADRKALLALTDGRNNAGRVTIAQVEAAAARAGVSIYCIGLGSSAGEQALRAMAEKTGGSLFVTRSPDDLTEIYRTISGLIRNQYEFEYESPAPRGGDVWRTLAVSASYRGESANGVRQYALLGTGAETGGGTTANAGILLPLIAALGVLNVLLIVGAIAKRRNC